MSAVKVKMLVGLSGPALTLNPGDEHAFAKYEAERLVEAGFAELAETDDERKDRLKAEADAANKAAAERAERLKADQEAAAKAAADAEAKAKAAADAGQEGDGGTQPAPTFSDLGEARKAYKAAFGKGAGPSWSIEVIAEKIAAKPAEG